MKVRKYFATCRFSGIGLIQEASEIIYSVGYETEWVSIINITKKDFGFTSTEEFRCQIGFRDCMGIIKLLKENSVYPSHGRDIVEDLGYKILSPT